MEEKINIPEQGPVYEAGMKLLRERMLELGATKQQAESKTVAIVVAAIAENPDIVKFEDVKDCLSRARETYKSVTTDIAAAQRTKKSLRDEVEALNAQVKKLKGLTFGMDTVEYINHFNEQLYYMSTPEASDRLKTAQVVINTFSGAEYPGEKMALVLAVGSILSGVPLDKISELTVTKAKEKKETEWQPVRGMRCRR